MAHSFSTPGLKVFPFFFFQRFFFFILLPNHFRCCPRRTVGVQCTRVELKFLSNLSIPFLLDKFNDYTLHSFGFSIYTRFLSLVETFPCPFISVFPFRFLFMKTILTATTTASFRTKIQLQTNALTYFQFVNKSLNKYINRGSDTLKKQCTCSN